MYPHLSGEESTKMIEDIALAMTIIFVFHILSHVVNENVELLDVVTIQYSLYIILGIGMYHMVIRKFVI